MPEENNLGEGLLTLWECLSPSWVVTRSGERLGWQLWPCQHRRDRATLELRSWLDFARPTHSDHTLRARLASPRTATSEGGHFRFTLWWSLSGENAALMGADQKSVTWHCLYPCCNHICTADIHPEKPVYQRELAERNGKKNLNGLESKSLSHPSQCGQSLAWDLVLLGPWSLIQRTKVKAHTNCTSRKQTKANLKDRSENTLQDSKQQATWERRGGIHLLLWASLHVLKETKKFCWFLGFNLCDYLFW